MTPPRSHGPPAPRTLYAALAASGCAALMYESAWGRILHRVFGVSDWAIATVIASFFLGMGLGALGGARWASRIRSPGRAYAFIEGGVALYAVASIGLLPRLGRVYAVLGPDASFAALSGARLALALAVLLPPTIGMGATLPVLLRSFEGREGWTERARSLYAVNTLGAAVGAGLTGFATLPTLGARGTLLLAAGLSTLAAGLGLLSARKATSPEAAPTPNANPPTASELAPSLLVVLAASSGLLSLAGEVLFTRMLRLVIQGTSQAFASMLTVYLLGLVIGATLARRPLGRALERFGTFQMLAALAVLVGIGSASAVPRLVGLLRGEAELVPHEPWVMLTVATLVLLPLAVLVGTGLPLVLALAEGEGASRSTGRLLAANTLGGLVGSLGAGFFAVPSVGLEAALYLLVVGHVLLAFVALASAAGSNLGARLRVFVALGMLATAASVVRPRLHLRFLLDAWNEATTSIVEGPSGYDEHPVVFLREGRNTTVTVIDRGDTLRLFNDGRPESGIGAGRPSFGPELVLLGGLPGVFAGRRDRGMIIGLGAGHSATMLLESDFARVDVVELEPAVVEAARTLHRMRAQPFPLDDRRAHLVVDDARVRLHLAAPGSYDAIVSQPSHPWLAGASALYTEEFFGEARRALRPGGVLSLWVNVFRMDVTNLRRVTATLTAVFPHVVAFVTEESSFLLLASDRPFDYSRVSDRLAAAPRLRSRLADYQLDTAPALLATLELDEPGTRSFGRGGERLVDDVPRLEYSLTRIHHGATVTHRELDGALAHIPWIERSTHARIPAHLASSIFLFRLSRLEARRAGVERVRAAARLAGLAPSGSALVEGGALETLGDVAGALGRYDAAGLDEAAARADSLRRAELGPVAALRAARGRTVLPADANDLLRAAIESHDPAAVREALAVADRTPATEDAALTRVARAFEERGCPGVRGVPGEAETLDVARLRLWLACVAEVGDAAYLERTAMELAIARRSLAQDWFDRGDEAFEGGNLPLAVRFFRRALREWPAHRDAAEKVADALCSLGRCEDAVPLVQSALAALRHADPQAAALRTAVERLGVRLPP